ncbi:MAG: hypothetical protein HN560_06400 [Anaerolineae bacterium]|jgi:hypothetical protein|nr:hypothetical protein [Anaerolineae bacterium]
MQNKRPLQKRGNISLYQGLYKEILNAYREFVAVDVNFGCSFVKFAIYPEGSL